MSNKEQPKIVQITSVVEGSYAGETYWHDDEATVYGLGVDGRIYYWGRTKTTRIKHDEPDEEGNEYHDEHEWGWKPYQP